MITPASLSPLILASLARLGGGQAAQRPAPVTHPGGAVTPFSAAGVTAICEADQELSPSVTPVTPVTPQKRMHCDGEERAAILEFDGGWSRELAEIIATREVDLLASGAGPEEWAALDRELMALEAGRDQGWRPGARDHP